MRNAKTTMKRYLIYLFCFISITLYANDKKENCLLPRFPEERIEDFQDNYDSLINIHQTKYGAFVEFKKEFIQMTKRFPFMYGDIIVSFNNCKIENGNLAKKGYLHPLILSMIYQMTGESKIQEL
jgi:hypothetical protein